MDFTEIKQKILTFRLPNDPSNKQTYTRVLLQLFGYAGHGKSAFVNSCLYTLGTGAFQTPAKTGSSGNIITMNRNSYKLTDAITIVDNRGFGKKDGAEEAVVYAQLGHFLPLDKEVVPANNFDQLLAQVEYSDLTPNYTDFMVPIFVYSVKTTMPKEQIEEVKTFFKNCREMTGVTPIVVLTHKSHRNYNDQEDTFRLVGAEEMIAIENYTPEDHKKTLGRCSDIQNVILVALNNVTFRLQQPRNPIKDRIVQKIFLLKFAHEFTVQVTKSEAEKKAKRAEYERLEALANNRWFNKFPYGK